MPSSGFFNTVDSGARRDDFPDSLDGFWENFPHLRSTFVASPEQLLEPLPNLDSPMYPTAHEAHHPLNFTTAFPNPNAYTPSDFYGWPLQTDLQSIRYYTSSGPATHQQSMTLNVGPSSMYDSSQGCLSEVVNGPLPVHDAFYSHPSHFSPPKSTLTRVQSHHIDQTESFNSDMGTLHRQTQPALASVTQSSSSIISGLAFEPMASRFPLAEVPPIRQRGGNSREIRFVTSPPYHPIRTSSLPVQSISPKEAVSHTCGWMSDDGTICGAQITRRHVPEHLTTHGIKNMAHNSRLPCRWSGCRIRGDKATMNRESIVRHIRETHLGYRRTL